MPKFRALFFKDKFKHANLLVPKYAFTGDPTQAYWTSDFHHIAPYAKVDQKHHQLQLRVRRDMIKTRSGGGFGARVSTTRWSKYGSFAVKLKSASTGPGIVTAIVLSNPANGDEISFELTGRDPKTVYTNYYHRVPKLKKETEEHSHKPEEEESSHDNSSHERQSGHENHRHSSSHKREKEHEHIHHNHHPEKIDLGPLTSHEEQHALKKDSTKNFLTYKIEWNEKMIRWSVDGKVLRTVHVEKVTDKYTNIPSNAMQFQLTVWDGGYAPETSDWSGGKTDYGADNLDEYIATIDSVEIHCQDNKEGNKPWPGPEAMKRLKLAEQQAKIEAQRMQEREAAAEQERRRQMGMLYPERRAGALDTLFRPVVHFFDTAVLTLVKWTFVLLAIVCAGAYVTEPKQKHSRNYQTRYSKPVALQ
ncbi:hypothetical protein BGW41_001811 [Actinomortierella wolfii]|nr:hypothetical protein BGW41_001811 [Actinomortierella wolfii]